MEFEPVELEELFRIERLITVHYFQFARGYLFAGEKHDFWEFVYMDKGAAEIGADGQRFLLSEGEAVFHMPGEFHTIWAGGNNPPDIIIFSFISHSGAMEGFRKLRTQIDEEGKALIARAVEEACNAWENDIGGPYFRLEGKADGPAGAEQMVRMSLEALLIHLLRALDGTKHSRASAPGSIVQPKTLKGRNEYLTGLAVEMEDWIGGNLDAKITIESLCSRFNIGSTTLKRLFRRRLDCGVMEHVSMLRHEAAKRLIREGYLSMAAIAEKCGYGTVHYFSRRFSRTEGMTPSEYAHSVKSKANLPNRPY